MPAKNTSGKATTKKAAKPRTNTKTTQTPVTDEAASTVGTVRTRVVDAAETAVNVPVGAALNVADRVNEVVEPWTDSKSAEAELKRLRTQIQREVNKAERRGGTARRRARQRVRQTRNRLERELRQRRRKLGTDVRRRRRTAETELRRRQREVEAELRTRRSELTDLVVENREQLEKVVRETAERVTSRNSAAA